ncbi:MAG: ATP-binding protein [Clostridium sp.]|nr:ATP-binding protein [Acetatifactor muris]MCM1527086.1 ATP-binding protein [Bacteroides sp.]MCM1563401.1 ATP-binding protein [Clostridium sp.]
MAMWKRERKPEQTTEQMAERKTEQTTDQTTDREREQRRFEWLTRGLIVCLAASGIWIACYGMFQSRVESLSATEENVLMSQSLTDWLMRNTYVLYRDLVQKNSSDPVDYRNLYIRPREGCEWVTDESLVRLWRRGALDGVWSGTTSESGMSADLSEEVPDNIPTDSGRVYACLEQFDDHFEGLESIFPYLNENFGYSCEDTATGIRVGNLDGSRIDEIDQYFYLVFDFDEYGNCTIDGAKCGDDGNAAVNLRRTAGMSARQNSLEKESFYVNYNTAADVPLDTYMTMSAPVNCRVTYWISKTEWAKIQERGEIYLPYGWYNVDEGHYYNYWSCGAENECMCLWLIVLLLAVFMPLNLPAEETGGSGRFLRSVEFLILLAWIGFWGAGGAFSLWMMSGILSGRAEAAVRQFFWNLGVPSLGNLPILALLYIGNLLMMTVLFFVSAWYVGLNLREIRRIGLRAYIRKRCVCWKFFPYVKSKVVGIWDSFVHYDLSQKANKKIMKLLLVNGIVLFIISSLWVGGLAVAVIYSALLYVVLRKYISDLQKKYMILLNATNEIAQGNLNVQIKEDVGVFEPFKPQIQRIQQGFRNAVEQEVKSQRMKAELITNVSHDLKTPLTAIITYIDLLKDEQITEEQRREYLDTLERKALRLKVLIEDLFEISRADSHNMNLHIVDVDIVNLMKQVAFEMGDKLSEKNLDLRMDLPEEKILLSLDSQRTYRIYENLFGNIAKYAMPGTRVYVNGFRQRDSVVFILRNITEQEISVNPMELTERFVRGDASRNTEGSGLGLAIAKSFAELQGGSLEIQVDGDLFKAITVWKLQ